MPGGEPVLKRRTDSTQRYSNASNGSPQSSPPKEGQRVRPPKTVAGVAGPVGVPAVCRASSHPFGECAQLETVGHNPRTAFTRRNLQRSADGGLHFPITPFTWRLKLPARASRLFGNIRAVTLWSRPRHTSAGALSGKPKDFRSLPQALPGTVFRPTL